MHELSIAAQIIEIAEEECRKANAGKVKELEIEVGAVSGIMVEALEFALSVSFENTLLEGCSYAILLVEATARCEDCNRNFILENILDPCPHCFSFRKTILSGKELKIKSIMVD